MAGITVKFNLLTKQITVTGETIKIQSNGRSSDYMLLVFQSSDDAVDFTEWAQSKFPEQNVLQDCLGKAMSDEKSFADPNAFPVSYPENIWATYLSPAAMVIPSQPDEIKVIDDNPTDNASERFRKHYQAMSVNTEKTIECARDIHVHLRKEAGNMILLDMRIAKDESLLKFDTMSRLGWIINEISQSCLPIAECEGLGGVKGFRISEKSLLEFLIAFIDKIERSMMFYQGFLTAANDFIDSNKLFTPKFKIATADKPPLAPRSLFTKIPSPALHPHQRALPPISPAPSVPPVSSVKHSNYSMLTHLGKRIHLEIIESMKSGLVQLRFFSHEDAEAAVKYLKYANIGTIPTLIQERNNFPGHNRYLLNVNNELLELLKSLQEIGFSALTESNPDDEKKMHRPIPFSSGISSGNRSISTSVSSAIPSTLPLVTTNNSNVNTMAHPLADLLPKVPIKQILSDKSSAAHAGPSFASEAKQLCYEADAEIQHMKHLIATLQKRLQDNPEDAEITAFLAKMNDVSLYDLAKQINQELCEDKYQTVNTASSSTATLLANSMGQVLRAENTTLTPSSTESDITQSNILTTNQRNLS